MGNTIFHGQITAASNFQIFGPNRLGYFALDLSDHCTIKRYCGALNTLEEIDEDNASATDFMANPFALTYASWGTDDNPEEEKTIQSYPASTGSSANMTFGTHVLPKVSGAITKDKTSDFILFDRTHPDSFVLFEDLGRGYNPQGGNITFNSLYLGGVNGEYYGNLSNQNGLSGGAEANSIFNNSCYNGDEIHIQVKVRCWKDVKNSSHSHWARWGYNRCAPRIFLTDNGVNIPDTKFVLTPAINYGQPGSGIDV